MSGSYVLVGAYASLARNNGIALYGSAESLRELASVIRAGGLTDIGLSAPPDDALEVAPLRGIRVLTGDREPVELRAIGEVIEMAGGSDALNKLAATFENLAAAPELGGLVPRHVDLEYFPGHGFLGEGSVWMTVTLLSFLSP